METCPECGAPVMQARNKRTGAMGLLDKEPSKQGNCVLLSHGFFQKLSAKAIGTSKIVLYSLHRDTCTFGNRSYIPKTQRQKWRMRS